MAKGKQNLKDIRVIGSEIIVIQATDGRGDTQTKFDFLSCAESQAEHSQK